MLFNKMMSSNDITGKAKILCVYEFTQEILQEKSTQKIVDFQGNFAMGLSRLVLGVG